MKILILLFVFISTNLLAIDCKIDFNSVKAHIDNQFYNAKIEMSPYPHLIIQDILPESLYEQMQYFWPESSCFDHQCQPNRHLYVTKGTAELHPLTPDQVLFWRTFGEVVGTYIKDNIKEKFIPLLDWKFPQLSQSELNELKNTIRFFDSRQDSLMEHHYGYGIHTHCDQHYLFATALLYCPIDNSQTQLSTTLLEPCGNKKFNVVKRIPYTRNTLLVMPTHEKQWHASERHRIPNYIRKMYGLFIHLAPDITELYYGKEPLNYTQDWIYYTWEQRFVKFNPHGQW